MGKNGETIRRGNCVYVNAPFCTDLGTSIRYCKITESIGSILLVFIEKK